MLYSSPLSPAHKPVSTPCMRRGGVLVFGCIFFRLSHVRTFYRFRFPPLFFPPHVRTGAHYTVSPPSLLVHTMMHPSLPVPLSPLFRMKPINAIAQIPFKPSPHSPSVPPGEAPRHASIVEREANIETSVITKTHT